MNILLPQDVKYIIDKFYDNGYEAFIVGGCVRDCIIGLEPTDYDITTNAKPDEIKEIFKSFKTIDVGIKHGTVSVIIDSNAYEITTYRVEGEYVNNRKPKEVSYTTNLEEDLKRRDFTINAMAYNDRVGLVDIFNSLDDIENRLIKAVGNPDKRFSEDGLRMIRAIRFSSKLGFRIEKQTLEGINKNMHLIKNISSERVTDEFNKILLSENPQDIIYFYKMKVFENLNIFTDINEDNVNEIEKTLHILKRIDKDILSRISMLKFILIINNLKANSLMSYLKYSKKILLNSELVLKYMNLELDDIGRVRIKNILSEDNEFVFKKAIELKALYYNDKKMDILVDNIKNIIEDIKQKNECYTVKDLEIDGKELMELGKQGKYIGILLKYLLQEVIKKPELNNKNDLIDLVYRYDESKI